MEFEGFGAQQVNITLFEKKQHFSVSAFCNTKVGLKNYKIPIPLSFIFMYSQAQFMLYIINNEKFSLKSELQGVEGLHITSERRGRNLTKKTESQVRKDRWMSKPVNAIYSNIKPIFEISAVFKYLQSQNLKTVPEFTGL